MDIAKSLDNGTRSFAMISLYDWPYDLEKISNYVIDPHLGAMGASLVEIYRDGGGWIFSNTSGNGGNTVNILGRWKY